MVFCFSVVGIGEGVSGVYIIGVFRRRIVVIICFFEKSGKGNFRFFFWVRFGVGNFCSLVINEFYFFKRRGRRVRWVLV